MKEIDNLIEKYGRTAEEKISLGLALDEYTETQALALEGMKKMYETGTPMNPDYDYAFNQALQQAADHLRAQKIKD